MELKFNLPGKKKVFTKKSNLILWISKEFPILIKVYRIFQNLNNNFSLSIFNKKIK